MKKVIYLVCWILISCNFNQDKTVKLKPISIFDLPIREPSGLAVYKNYLFIVSDHNGTIYNTSLHGEVLNSIKTTYHDLEGITIDKDANIWIVSEAKRKLIQLDTLGKTITKIKVKGKQKFKNKGLEGVCYQTNNDNFYLLNEKYPCEIIHLSKKGKFIDSHKLNFSGDVSGICFDEVENCFWIVSDESKAVFKINYLGEVLGKFKIPVIKAEGIAIYKEQLYVVSDKESKLYVFKKPS